MSKRTLAIRVLSGMLGLTVTVETALAQQGSPGTMRMAGSGPAPVVGPAPVAGQLPSTANPGAPTSNSFSSSPSTVQGSSSSKLQVYDLPKEMAGVVAARLQVLFSGDPSIRIDTVPNNGKLMVYASENAQRNIAMRVQAIRQEIERSGGTPSTQQRSYKLRYITWRELEDALQRLAGPQMTVTTLGNGEVAQFRLTTDAGSQDVLQVDRRLDQVTLQGTPTNIHAWLQVVTAVDAGKENQEFPTQIIPLAPADPVKVERALKLVRMVRQQPPDDEDQIVTEEAAVTQPQRGDNDPATALGGVDDLGSESGLFGDVQIEFVPELGLVIVKGQKRDVQRVLEVIEKIKKQSEETQPEVVVHTLKHVDSQSLATVVRQLYTDVLSQRQGQVSITSLVQPNALLLIGRKEAIESLIELLSKLDQPLDPTSQLRVFRLIHASAVDAQTTIRGFFVERPGSNEDPRTALGTQVRVIADYRTNSLIIQASPRDLSEVARLIQEIDVESTPAQNELRVFPLKNALSDDLANVLMSAISGSTSGGTGNQGGQGGGAVGGTTSSGSATPVSSKLSIINSDRGTTDSGILAGVVVTSNPSINALLVRAPSKSMQLIEALINQLDQQPSAEAQIKVFEIKNGDATALATTMQQLFGLPATAGQNTTGGFLGLGAQNLAGLTGGGESSLVQLRITVDTRTNSIVASGSPSDLDVMYALLLRLDQSGIQNRTTEVIWLRNSNAQDLATAITNLVTQQRQIINQTLITNQAIGPFEQIDREVLVVAEPSTNSLIVSATPRYARQIREVIERLDRRPPLVMVQILLAEVTLEDSFDAGVEWGLQDSLLFDRGSASGGTLGSPGFNIGTPLGNNVTRGIPQNVAGQGVSNFGLGRQNSALGYGGLVLSAASESVNVLLRALQDANRLQILSRPQVMTIDNVEAFVQVGANVPRVQGVSQTQFGNQINTVDAPVGLLMRLQPRTNQDGLILMNVAVERSSVGPEATGIPVGFGPNGEVIRSPIINRTLAQTRVTAYDGQTVVFAGLISKTRSSRSRRIPLLADIPLAGALFRFDSETEARSELLVVMTPHIVRTPEEMAMIVDVESSRMSWCLADVLNIHGDTNLSPGNGLWGPAASPVIYPDLQPIVEEGSSRLPGESLMINGQSVPVPSQPMYQDSIQGFEIQSPSGSAPTIEIAPEVQPSRYVPNSNTGVSSAGYQAYSNSQMPSNSNIRR